MIEIGIDVGGTFTDVVMIDRAAGRLHVAKTASTPQDQSIGILAGLKRLGVDPHTIDRFTHGTTVATNTVLERKGARVAMLTTAGFRDLLEIGRTNRTKVYDMKLMKPAPLVPRGLRFEVAQRTHVHSLPATPPSAADIDAALERCRAEGVEAIAVCYLHSYADPSDEEATVAAIRASAPDIHVTASSDVVREYKEYERFSTATLNAYVMPVMARYLSGLEGRLGEGGYRHPIEVMRSGGGLMRADTARRYPVETLLSGPAAGVMGALRIAESSGTQNLVTYDMGGTSTDVALIAGGQVTRTAETRIADLPLKTNQIDIVTVGAGGGSIAHLGIAGELRVGPESAGASPGPACYGKGGDRATVTDANMVLGRLSSSYALGGEIKVRPERAEAVVDAIAKPLGLSREAMGEGILKLVNTRMASAIREISIQRGHDPRDFALVAYGGAGPMHAVDLARDLSMPRVIIPPAPGNLCAFGLLVTDLAAEQSETLLARLDDIDAADLAARFAALGASACASLVADGVAADTITLSYAADMRYVGQKSDIPVPVVLEDLSTDDLADAFFRTYAERFNHTFRKAPCEIVTVRVSAQSAVDRSDLAALTAPEPAGDADASGVIGRRKVHFPGVGWVDCVVYDRYRLPPGRELAGPAIVEELGSTSVIAPGDVFALDAAGNIIVTIAPEAAAIAAEYVT